MTDPLIQFAHMQLMASDVPATEAAIQVCVEAGLDNWHVAQLRGRLCMLQRDYLGAYDHLSVALMEHPDAPHENPAPVTSKFHTMWSLGKCCMKLGFYPQAEELFRNCTLVDTNVGEMWMELGAAHACQRHYPELLTCSERAVALSPDSFDCRHSLGAACYMFGNDPRAIEEFRIALELNPDQVHVEVALSSALLRNGEWEEGWRRFEARWGLPTPISNWDHRGQVLFDGKLTDLRGKRVLLRSEQGYGDTLQFARYIPALRKIIGTGRLILEVQPGLERLLKSLPVDEIRVARVSNVLQQVVPLPNDELPPYDIQTTLMSMPYLFGTLPDAVPPPFRYTPMLQPGYGRIGVCWHGGARRDDPDANAVDQRRSLTREQVQPLLDAIPACRSLQQQDLRTSDWMSTAQIVNSLDLVITVDTAIAHLAGSLGVPVWLLNRFDSCYRWGMFGDTTVWYPSMRIFRQPRLGDWASVIKTVVKELGARV